MHSETVRSGFDNPIWDYGTASFFWVVKAGEDLLFHSGNWVPVLIDYGSISGHDLSTFDTNTLDSDYVARNFPNPQDVHVVRNSSDLFMISFTAESKLSYSLKKWWPYRFKYLRTTLKVYMAHNFLFNPGTLDPLKRTFFSMPVRLQGGSITESNWQMVEARAAPIIKKIESGEIPLCWRLFGMLHLLMIHGMFFCRYRLKLLRQYWTRTGEKA